MATKRQDPDSIYWSLAGPSMRTQLRRSGIAHDVDKVKFFERRYKEICTLSVHRLLTENERDSAVKRLSAKLTTHLREVAGRTELLK